MLIKKGNKIEFGDGEISINIGDTIIGFDILLSGNPVIQSIHVLAIEATPTAFWEPAGEEDIPINGCLLYPLPILEI